ncbi:MAG: FAD-dependent oxidoreductase [Solirubrobacteraceae bacterium]
MTTIHPRPRAVPRGSSAARRPTQVLIVGGGFAAVEAALALKALAEDRVQLTLLAPEPLFRYRPAATRESFDVAPTRAYDLATIASDVGASYHQGRLEAVASRKQWARTAAGARLQYDRLILATGARPVAGVPGAITFRDQRDVSKLRRLVGEIEAGAVRRVAFALPAGTVWPLPLYELALLSAKRARERGATLECTIISPEGAPLEMFGPAASRVVGDLLEDGGVRFLRSSVAAEVGRDGSLVLSNGASIDADRVVALPELRGRRITGVPGNPSGFVPVDTLGQVEGLQNVYAAGDLTTFPIKQGGLAAQQADVVAQTLAEQLGGPVKQVRAPCVLRARLVGGDRPLFLRTEFDWSGHPTNATLEGAGEEREASTAKVLGRYLVPYLETHEPLSEAPTQSRLHTASRLGSE